MQVKARCLDAIAKVLQHAPTEQLQALLAHIPLASFVTALLGSRDSSTLAAAVRLAELLMGKLPELYRRAFRREGVVHAMEQLATAAPSPTLPSAPPQAVKGKERERQASDKPKRSSSRGKVLLLPVILLLKSTGSMFVTICLRECAVSIAVSRARTRMPNALQKSGRRQRRSCQLPPRLPRLPCLCGRWQRCALSAF